MFLLNLSILLICAIACRQGFVLVELPATEHKSELVKYEISRAAGDYGNFDNKLREYKVNQTLVVSIKNKIDLSIAKSGFVSEQFTFEMLNGYCEMVVVVIKASISDNDKITLDGGMLYAKQDFPQVNNYRKVDAGSQRYGIFGPREYHEYCTQRDLNGEEIKMIKDKLIAKVKEFRKDNPALA